MEPDRARATRQSELPAAALSTQASGSSAKASSSPPPNTSTTTTHSPLLPSSTHLSPPHHNPPPPPPPPSIISSSPPLAPRRVTPAFNTHLPITRRRTRSLHILHHGSVIENACCCPRNGWRRRCSSAGKSCFMISHHDTMVLACPCMRTRNPPSEYRKSYRSVYLESGSALLVSRSTARWTAVASSLLCSCWLASMVSSQQRQRKLVCISIHGASKTTYATNYNLKHAGTTKEATSIPGRGGQLQRSDNVLQR